MIAITDHDSVKGSLNALRLAQGKYKNKMVVIPGVEITSKEGHILAYNVKEDIPSKMSAEKTLSLIKKKGGFAVAAHPFNRFFSLKWKAVMDNIDDFFAIEASNSRSFRNKEAREFADLHSLPFTAGSDAHSIDELGLCSALTREKMYNMDELFDIIEKRKIKLRTDDNHILGRAIPELFETTLYWKKHQLKHLFNKNLSCCRGLGIPKK